MVWYVWRWWRFAVECGEGFKSSTLRIEDGFGIWKPLMGTRLVVLVERAK